MKAFIEKKVKNNSFTSFSLSNSEFEKQTRLIRVRRKNRPLLLEKAVAAAAITVAIQIIKYR